MATDKSLNIRQVKAAENVAADIAELKAMVADLQKQVESLTVAVLSGDKPSRSAGRK